MPYLLYCLCLHIRRLCFQSICVGKFRWNSSAWLSLFVRREVEDKGGGWWSWRVKGKQCRSGCQMQMLMKPECRAWEHPVKMSADSTDRSADNTFWRRKGHCLCVNTIVHAHICKRSIHTETHMYNCARQYRLFSLGLLFVKQAHLNSCSGSVNFKLKTWLKGDNF